MIFWLHKFQNIQKSHEKKKNSAICQCTPSYLTHPLLEDQYKKIYIGRIILKLLTLIWANKLHLTSADGVKYKMISLVCFAW